MLNRGRKLVCLALFTLASAAAEHSKAINDGKTTARGKGRLAIIIDDIGYNKSQSERAARLKGAFTLSILPFTPYGVASANLAHQHGKELMLHLPMSTINDAPLGKGGLVSSMDKTTFLRVVRQDLDSLPLIQGVNNHMGSRMTQETTPMEWLMEELRPRGLYFIDSRTSAQTKALDTALRHQVPGLKRDVFLDGLQNTGAIEFQLNRALKLARQNGYAIAIGHPYPTTLAVLERMQPLLDDSKVRLVYVSELIQPTMPHTADRNREISTHRPSNSMHIAINGVVPYCQAPSAGLVPQIPAYKTRTSVDFYDKFTIMAWRIIGY